MLKSHAIQISDGEIYENVSLYAYTRDLSTEISDSDVLFHVL